MAQIRQTNRLLEALNGLFQAAKRRARGFTRLSSIRTLIFLIAGKFDFRVINLHAHQPTSNSTEPNFYVLSSSFAWRYCCLSPPVYRTIQIPQAESVT